MHVLVVYPVMEISFAHQVYQSTMVKRYVMNSDSGSRPTMSTGEIQSTVQVMGMGAEGHGSRGAWEQRGMGAEGHGSRGA